MTSLNRSVTKTIKYSGYFRFPISPKEIHYWLISSKNIPWRYLNLKVKLPTLSKAQKQQRLLLEIVSNHKHIQHENILSTIARIPTIKLITVTGSVAVKNAQDEDDLDLMIVTANHTLWLTRVIVTLLLVIYSKKRYPYSTAINAKNTICTNLWLEDVSLKVPKCKRNMYTAHEVLQTVSVFERDGTYSKFVYQNSWVGKYLRNAYTQKTHITPKQNNKKRSDIFWLLFPLNLLMYVLQRCYMSIHLSREYVGYHFAYFHPINHLPPIKKHLKTA